MRRPLQPLSGPSSSTHSRAYFITCELGVATLTFRLPVPSELTPPPDHHSDGLRTAQKRHYRETNLARLHRDIETLAFAVVDETELFLANCERRAEEEAGAGRGGAETDAKVAERYGELISRLNL